MNELNHQRNSTDQKEKAQTETMNWIFPVWNVLYWINSADFFSEEHLLLTCSSTYCCRHHHRVRLIGLMAFFPPRPSRYTVGWESAGTIEKSLAVRHGCVHGSNLARFFGGKMMIKMIKPVDLGKIPSKSLSVQIPNRFCGSWCLKRSHACISLHHGSQASLLAKHHGSFQFYRGSSAGAGFSCPGRTFGCTLGHPSDRMKFSPGCTSKINPSSNC